MQRRMRRKKFKRNGEWEPETLHHHYMLPRGTLRTVTKTIPGLFHVQGEKKSKGRSRYYYVCGPEIVAKDNKVPTFD